MPIYHNNHCFLWLQAVLAYDSTKQTKRVFFLFLKQVNSIFSNIFGSNSKLVFDSQNVFERELLTWKIICFLFGLLKQIEKLILLYDRNSDFFVTYYIFIINMKKFYRYILGIMNCDTSHLLKTSNYVWRVFFAAASRHVD